MPSPVKIKLVHLTANGEKLELETFAEADSLDDAVTLATARFRDILTCLDATSLTLDTVKVERHTP